MSSKSINAGYAVNSLVDAIDTFLFSTTTDSCDFGYFPTRQHETFPNFNDFWTKFNFPTYTYVYCGKENYPITNQGITKDGSTIIQIAVTGFKKEDISLKRDDMKLIISGKKPEDSDEKLKDVKWIGPKQIAERSFNLEILGNEKWNWEKDAIESNIENGILTVKIPLKEESKPKHETYDIK